VTITNIVESGVKHLKTNLYMIGVIQVHVHIKILHNYENELIEFWCFFATFSNISAISWRPVLMGEETGVPGENHQQWASIW
jgi:hypothetical protein